MADGDRPIRLAGEMRFTIGQVCKAQLSVKQINALFVYSGCDPEWWAEPKILTASERENRVNGWFEGIETYAREQETEIAGGVCRRLLAYQELWDNNRQAIEMVLQSIDTQRGRRIGQHNLDQRIVDAVGTLFDDRHYSRAVQNGFVALVNAVKAKANRPDLDGKDLMLQAFRAADPILRISETEAEQMGYMWLFAGSVSAIRNPLAHSAEERLGADEALELLVFASLLFRFLDRSQKAK